MEVIGRFLVDRAIAFKFILLSMEGSLVLHILFSSHVGRLDIGLHSLEAITDSVTSIHSSVVGSICIELSSVFTIGRRTVRSSSSEEFLLVSFELSGSFHFSGNISGRIF